MKLVWPLSSSPDFLDEYTAITRAITIVLKALNRKRPAKEGEINAENLEGLPYEKFLWWEVVNIQNNTTYVIGRICI